MPQKMSEKKLVTFELTCERCQRQLTMMAQLLIDARRDVELIDLLRLNELNRPICPYCSYKPEEGILPFILMDSEHGWVAYVIPSLINDPHTIDATVEKLLKPEYERLQLSNPLPPQIVIGYDKALTTLDQIPAQQQRINFIHELSHIQSEEEAVNIISNNFDLIDSLFFTCLESLYSTTILAKSSMNSSVDSFRISVCVVLLESIGILDDPEINGAREKQIIASSTKLILSPNYPAWLDNSWNRSIPYEVIQQLMTFAVERVKLVDREAAITSICIVSELLHHCQKTTDMPGAPDTPSFLKAVGEAAFGQIMCQLPNKEFEAIGYLRESIEHLEALYDKWGQTDRKTVESILMRLSGLLFEVVSRHKRK